MSDLPTEIQAVLDGDSEGCICCAITSATVVSLVVAVLAWPLVVFCTVDRCGYLCAPQNASRTHGKPFDTSHVANMICIGIETHRDQRPNAIDEIPENTSLFRILRTSISFRFRESGCAQPLWLVRGFGCGCLWYHRFCDELFRVASAACRCVFPSTLDVRNDPDLCPTSLSTTQRSRETQFFRYETRENSALRDIVCLLP